MSDRNAQIIISLRNQASPEIQKIAGDYRAFITQLQAGGATLDQAERKMVALAQAKARTFSSAGQAARGEQELTAALGLVTRESTAAYSAQTQLANIQRGNGTLAQQFGTALKSGLLGIAGPAALVTTGFQAIRGSVEAAKQALDLREAQNALRAVSGGVQVYAQALSTARRQQILFGGSLKENIEGLQGLVITSRDTGASLQSLVDLSQRLEIKSPEQGVAGARIALQEAFSEGNITSLARRFEIPRDALAAFKDESISTAEKARILSTYLDSVGLSSAAVAGKADQTALAYRNLNAELEATSTNLGGQLADAFARQATGLARLFGVINDNPQAIAELLALQNGKGAVDQGDIEHAAQLIRVKNILPAEGGARDNAFARDKLTGTTANTDALDAAKNQLVRFAATSDEASARVAALLAEFGHTGNIAAFDAGVRSLIGSVNHGSRAARDQKDALAELRAEMAESAQASVKDAAQKDAQSAVTALLTERSRLAVDQFLALNPTIDASAVASKAAADGYDPQIRQLILMGVEARNATNALAALNGGGVTEGRSERDTPQDLAQARTAGLQLIRDQADAQAKAERDRLNRTGTTAQKLAQAQKDAAAAATPLEKFNAQTRVMELQQQLAAEQLRGAKSHTSELSKQLSLEERIYDAKNKQLKATLDASAAIIRDRQQRRIEDQEIRTAQRILASGKSSQLFKDAASDKLALIGIEQQQRVLDINEKLATANGQVIGGRVFQSKPGTGGVPNAPPNASSAKLAPIPQSPPSGVASASGLPTIEVTVTLDGSQIAANVVTRLRGGLAQHDAGGG